MPASSAFTAAAAARDPLRVVFFGNSFTGKSALLRSFATIASAGAEERPVELALGPVPQDPSGRLVVRTMLSVDLPDVDGTAPSVTLVDCDGTAVGQLLRDASALTRPRVRNELLDSIRTADALLVTVDATDTATEVAALLEDLRPFLAAFRAGRAFGREVTGLPVFLTLTKCDRLYEAGMPPREWLDVIEDRKSEVQRWFDDALGDHSADPVPFGQIVVRPAATATKVPDPANFANYADANGAFETHRLLRDVLAAANDYRARRRVSAKRLNWTVGLSLGLLGTLMLAFVLLALTGEPGPVEQLTLQARDQMDREGAADLRLADRNFARNRQRFRDLRANPRFAELPIDIQNWAHEREREFAAYEEYRKRFQPPQFSPAEIRTAGELNRLTGELETPLAPPEQYATAWAKTEAVQLRQKWRADRELLLKAEGELHDWYRNLIRRSARLMAVEVPGAAWRDEASTLLREASSPPVKRSEAIPGSPVVAVRRGQALTYAAAFDFERTSLARQEWELIGKKVTDLRDLTDALGLTTDPAMVGAPLDLPEPTADPLASLSLGAERWQAIRTRFPQAVNGTANWAASFYPDPLRKELARRSRTATDTALRHVRRLIVNDLNLNGRADTPADWRKLPDGVLAAPQMQEWSRLVQLLLRCAELDRPDTALPVADLAAFVSKTSFEWNPTAVEIFLPTALLTDAYKPERSFTITIAPPGGQTRASVFGPASDPERTARGTRYRLPFDRTSAPLVYRPGEILTAELTVKTGSAAYKLKWAAGGTSSYQFDRLTREPEVEPSAGGVSFPATGVQLFWSPAKEAITVPELLPVLK